MTIKTVDRLLSFKEYLNYDDGTNNRYELVLGKLEIMNPPKVRHFLIAKFIEQVFDTEIKYRVTVLVLNEGLYEESIFTASQKIVSPTFEQLKLTPKAILSV